MSVFWAFLKIRTHNSEILTRTLHLNLLNFFKSLWILLIWKWWKISNNRVKAFKMMLLKWSNQQIKNNKIYWLHKCLNIGYFFGWKYTGGAGCLRGTRRPSGYSADHIMTMGWVKAFSLFSKHGIDLDEFKYDKLGESILVIWSRRSKSGAGGAPIIGLAITVCPRGIGLAIRTFDLLSSDGKGPGKDYFKFLIRKYIHIAI